MSETTDQSAKLVTALRAGDRRAFEELFRLHFPKLFTFLRRYVQDPAVAEDLAQDVFVTLWARRESLEIRGSLTGYLYAAARNTALNHLKHERVVDRWLGAIRAEAHTANDEATRSTEHHELSLALEAALEELPQRQREVFTLSRDAGLSYPQIAETLGISVKAVEANISRALRKLRVLLAPFLSSR